VKEVELLDADGIVKKYIMAFKLKNKELKKIVGQLKNSATMHAKQADKLEKMSPAKMQDGPGGLSPKERVAKAQGREVGEMNKSSRFHPDNQGRGVKTAFNFGIEHKGIDSAARGTKGIGPDGKPLKMKSPMKGKLKPCQKAAAKKKFKVYPSAYANMWASNHKC